MTPSDKRILVVDDDPDILNFFQLVLATEGYTVTTAGTAEDGLKAFRERRPHLVFVDLMMEEVDAGTSLVKEIQALGGDQVPIYMVTSVGDSLNMTTDYATLGLKGVLQKPVDIKNLLRLVSHALA
jgi:DNA-binding response OmpR family regulator